MIIGMMITMRAANNMAIASALLVKISRLPAEAIRLRRTFCSKMGPRMTPNRIGSSGGI